MTNKNTNFKAKDGGAIYALAIFTLLILQIVFSIIIVLSGAENGSPLYNTLSLVASICFQAGYLAIFIMYVKSKKVTPPIFIKGNSIAAKGKFVSKIKIRPLFLVFGVLFSLLCFVFFYPAASAFDKLLNYIGYNAPPPFEINGGPLQIVLLVFATVILAPVCEELIYRSALLSGLKKQLVKKDGDFKANILCAALSGLAFSLMHMSPQQTVFQFFLGFCAALLALSSSSIIPSAIMHCVNNLIVILAGFFGPLNAPFEAIENVFLSNTWSTISSSLFFTAIGICLSLVMFKFLINYKKNKEGGVLALELTQEELPQQAGLLVVDESLNHKKKRPFFVLFFLALGVCAVMWAIQLFAGISG